MVRESEDLFRFIAIIVICGFDAQVTLRTFRLSVLDGSVKRHNRHSIKQFRPRSAEITGKENGEIANDETV